MLRAEIGVVMANPDPQINLFQVNVGAGVLEPGGGQTIPWWPLQRRVRRPDRDKLYFLRAEPNDNSASE